MQTHFLLENCKQTIYGREMGKTSSATDLETSSVLSSAQVGRAARTDVHSDPGYWVLPFYTSHKTDESFIRE